MKALQNLIKELEFSKRIDIDEFQNAMFKLGVCVTKAIRFNESSNVILSLDKKRNGQKINIAVFPNVKPKKEAIPSVIEETEIILAEMTEGRITRRLFRKMLNVICKSFVILDLDNLRHITDIDDTYSLQMKDIHFYQAKIDCKGTDVKKQTLMLHFGDLTILIYVVGEG